MCLICDLGALRSASTGRVGEDDGHEDEEQHMARKVAGTGTTVGDEGGAVVRDLPTARRTTPA
jgi:hypothetical protein